MPWISKNSQTVRYKKNFLVEMCIPLAIYSHLIPIKNMDASSLFRILYLVVSGVVPTGHHHWAAVRQWGRCEVQFLPPSDLSVHSCVITHPGSAKKKKHIFQPGHPTPVIQRGYIYARLFHSSPLPPTYCGALQDGERGARGLEESNCCSFAKTIWNRGRH